MGVLCWVSHMIWRSLGISLELDTLKWIASLEVCIYIHSTYIVMLFARSPCLQVSHSHSQLSQNGVWQTRHTGGKEATAFFCLRPPIIATMTTTSTATTRTWVDDCIPQCIPIFIESWSKFGMYALHILFWDKSNHLSNTLQGTLPCSQNRASACCATATISSSSFFTWENCRSYMECHETHEIACRIHIIIINNLSISIGHWSNE